MLLCYMAESHLEYLGSWMYLSGVHLASFTE